MKKILLTILITFGMTSISYASAQKDIKPISEKQIKRMDHKLTKHKAMKRNFKTQKEFKRTQQRRTTQNKRVTHSKMKRRTSKNMRYDTRQPYDNGYNYNRNGYYDDYRPIRQRGYSYSNRGWILAYQYDRASFYDNEGFFYGYFNRYGYYFEDVFYSYDRYYTYRDRIRGRGLFDRHYYMPANASHYGFCATRHTNRNFERGYDRY